MPMLRLIPMQSEYTSRESEVLVCTVDLSAILTPDSWLLPDNHIAHFHTLGDLDQGGGLDTGRDRRAARAIAFADFDKFVAFKRADGGRRQPEHVLLALQDDVYLHHCAWRELLAF